MHLMCNPSPQNIFITGGFGFLGQYIVQAVAQAYPQACIRVQVRTERNTVVPITATPNVHIFRANLLQPEEYEQHLAGIDTVIHNAAVVSFSKDDREKIINTNVNATSLLLSKAAEFGVKNFVFISSISAVAKAPPKISDESMYPDIEFKRRNDPYGYSKILGEVETLKYKEQMRVLILNPSVILGPGSRQIDGAIRLIRRLPLIPMISTLNSFVDVRDTAQAVVDVLERGRSGERYIITAENIRLVSFFEMLIKLMGRKARVWAVPKGLITAGDGLIETLNFLHINPGWKKISDLNVDKAYSNRKAREDLLWEPTYTIEDSLQAILDGVN
jgi:dihydroflavonol-4-reductase